MRTVSGQISLVTNPGFQFGAPPLIDNAISLKKKTTQYQFLGQLVHLLKDLRKKSGLCWTWVPIPARPLPRGEASCKPFSFSEPQNLF